MRFKYSKRSLEVLGTVDYKLQTVMTYGLMNSPHDIILIEGKRSLQRQQQLWRQGREIAGKQVTWVDGILKKSKHQSGKAIDFAIWREGKIVWTDEKAFKEVGEHIKKTAKLLKIDITWGGDWKGKKRDLPHVELK